MKSLLNNIFPALILAVLFWQFPGIGKTIDDLRRTNVRFVSALLSGEARQYFRARMGEDEIDFSALAAIYFLRRNEVREYQASEEVRRIHWYQRIVEGAWPIRIVESAPDRLFLASERLPKDCQKRGEKDGMVYAVCP